MASFLRSTYDFVGRHKKKFIALGVVAAGGVATYYYAKRMVTKQFEELREIHRKMDTQRAMQEDVARLKGECTHYTVTIFLPDVKKVLVKLTNPKTVTMEIKALRAKTAATSAASPSATADAESLARMNSLWDELKVQIVSRLVSSAYGLVMLDLLVRVQFHVLSRHAFERRSEAAAAAGDGGEGATAAPPVPDVITPAVRELFIYKSTDYLVNAGLAELVRVVHDAATARTSEWVLGQDATVSRARILAVFGDVRSAIEKNKGWFRGCLVPSEDPDVSAAIGGDGAASVDSLTREQVEVLGSMVGETMDLLESPHFETAFNEAVDAVMTRLVDDMSARSFEPERASVVVEEVPAADGSGGAASASPGTTVVDVTDAPALDPNEEFKLDKPVIMGMKLFAAEVLSTSLQDNKFAAVLERSPATERLCRDVYGLEEPSQGAADPMGMGAGLGLSSNEMQMLMSSMGGGGGEGGEPDLAKLLGALAAPPQAA